MVDSLQPLATASRFHVSVTNAHEPVSIDGDADRLQQVMFNLLSNAMKFTPPGGSLDVSCACAAEWAEIRVRDSGAGIPPDRLAGLFEQSWQQPLQSVGDHHPRGLGLGLVISRRIVERHGGTIEAISAGAGQGATFIVRLPRHAAQGAGAARSSTRNAGNR